MSTSPNASPRPGGWIIFAGCVLFVVGSLNALWGLAAILNDNFVTAGPNGVIVWSTTLWGWVQLIVGAIMIAVSLGLLSMQSWARWPAVFFAMASAVLQVGLLTAYPLWALIVIALDIIVIYQLTARWHDH